MDILSNLMLGLSVVMTPVNLWYLFVGVVVGMIIGIFPGLGPAAGISILLPLTFSMEPVTAIVMLAGIYYGTMYGGCITAIMLNTPGASSAVASTFDGYPLARQGRAGPALVMQASASFVGGTVGVILLTILAPVFSKVAQTFGPPEFFMVVLLGMLSLVAMLGRNPLYGIIAALVGFAIATVGVDIGSGQTRFTFGSAELLGGVDFVPIAIGLFGIAEVLTSMYRGQHASEAGRVAVDYRRSFWPDLKDWIETRFTFIRGSLIGFVVGIIPGAGATIASLISYSVETTVSKEPQRFGKGAMAGLVAPEAANNAACSGAMVPLLTLGIPGSASTAVLLAGFLMWGLRPGPLLMQENPEFAWGLIASMYVGNLMLVALCIFAIPVWTAMLRVPYRILAPIVVVLCTIGTYSVNSSMIEVWLMLGAGVMGFFMKRFDFSPAALVVAMVLGPLAENALQQSLVISNGSLLIFVQRPVSLLIGIVAIGIVAASTLLRRLEARARPPAGEPEPVAAGG